MQLPRFSWRKAWQSTYWSSLPARERRRIEIALVVSLVVHVALISLRFGFDKSGWPGLEWPWSERRAVPLELTVRIEPAPRAPAMRLRMSDGLGRVPPQVRLAQPAPASKVRATTPPPRVLAQASRQPETFNVPPPPPAVQPAPAAPAEETSAQPESEELARQQRVLAVQKEQEAKRLDEARRAEESRRADETRRLEVARAEEEARQQETAQRAATEAESLRQAEETARQQALARQKEFEVKRVAEEVAVARAKELERQRAEAEAVMKAEAERKRAQAERLERQRAEAERQRAEAAERQRADAERLARQRELEAKRLADEAAASRAREVAERQRAEAERQRAEAQAAAQRERERVAAAAPRAAPPAPPQGPRRRSIFGGERDVVLRMYVDSWRSKIERQGPINYPAAATFKSHGNPVATVAIRADGSLERVSINTSSGLKELDEAVMHIAKLLAPYSAFPPALARQFDVIEIRREWFFDKTLRLVDVAGRD